MKHQDYNQIGLPPLSLVGNPLFIPSFRLESAVEEETQCSKEIIIPALTFRKTQDDLWSSFFFVDNYQVCVIKEGSLVKITKEPEKKTLFGRSEEQVRYQLASMDQLLRDGLLIKTDYETAFSNLGILPYYQDEISNINRSQNIVYQVPHAKFERDGAVDVKPIIKNQARGKPVKNTLKELLDHLLPHPAATSARCHRRSSDDYF